MIVKYKDKEYVLEGEPFSISRKLQIFPAANILVIYSGEYYSFNYVYNSGKINPDLSPIAEKEFYRNIVIMEYSTVNELIRVFDYLYASGLMDGKIKMQNEMKSLLGIGE